MKQIKKKILEGESPTLKSVVAYPYPQKIRKLKGFLMFSGGTDKQHRTVMG